MQRGAVGGAVADRRVARSAATRAAVVEALLGLIEEGDLRPPAPRIAARAGVSLRSVFQHFADLDALFAAAADRQTERILRLAHRLDADGPLEPRLAAFVAQRARILEAIAPVRRAALLMEPFSAEIGVRLSRARRLGRVELQHVFAAELAAGVAARGDVLAALAAASGFSAWEALRAHQGLSVAAAQRAMALMLGALLRGTSAVMRGARRSDERVQRRVDRRRPRRAANASRRRT
jgi:AcrR family transcriptional regulator